MEECWCTPISIYGNLKCIMDQTVYNGIMYLLTFIVGSSEYIFLKRNDSKDSKENFLEVDIMLIYNFI